MTVPKKLKIGIACILAYGISSLLMQAVIYKDRPVIETGKIRQEMVKTASQAGTLLASFGSSIVRLASIRPVTESQTVSVSPAPPPETSGGSSIGFDTVPTPTPAPVVPTAAAAPSAEPSIIPTSPAEPTPQPTSKPKPTSPPKPTATPAPAPITADARPGSSIEEILKEVSKRACIPYAMLMATRTIESGVWFNNMTAATAKTYNTYGWWKTAAKSTVCSGLAYYTQSGKIPSDSPIALQGGATCTNGAQPGAYDQQIMGLMQVSQQEQDLTRKYTQATLPNNIDRRVLFDNALIYAIATKNRIGKSPQPSCDDWPEETVRLAAEKHFGACAYTGGNYCDRVWNYYKQYR